ncbi:MAG: HEAT repeat domain-containing protein [Phycisphaerae bacterium]|nr:HEAT repeat domain-containing protein [Phycisphaerae bacterium]
MATVVSGGCAATSTPPPEPQLRELATQCLRNGARLANRPDVRSMATEAIARALKNEAPLVLREALKDEHPVVRFTACMGLGELNSVDAKDAIRPLLNDSSGSVKVAAYFALERMGDASHRLAWRDAVTSAEDPAVRRNAVTALGRLKDKKVCALLWKAAAGDSDEGVRIQAVESLAYLGDTQAISRLIHDAYGGLAFKQPFSLLALGHVKDDRVIPALRARLAGAQYLEARLAAARSLGMQGLADGYNLALQSLDWNQPRSDLPDDPPVNQIMRVRMMATLALGDIGKREALGPLTQVMKNPDDERIQVAAATSILMILNAEGARPWAGR